MNCGRNLLGLRYIPEDNDVKKPFLQEATNGMTSIRTVIPHIPQSG